MVVELLGSLRVWVDCRQGSWSPNIGNDFLVMRLTSSIFSPSVFLLIHLWWQRAHSLLSQPIPYAHLWLPHNGGSTLWIHRFWIFAIASSLVFLLPLSPLYNLFSTKWPSKNPRQSLFSSKPIFQLFQRKVKRFLWLTGPYVT